MEKMELYVSKKKIILLLCGCLLFVIVGFWLLISNAIVMKVIGVIAILFFGIGFAVLAKKMFDKKPALIIDDEGITDNYTRPPMGVIEWEDIEYVEISTLMTNKILLIYVYDPQKYLDKFSGRSYQGYVNNYRLVGTPFVFPSGVLEYRLSRVKAIIDERLHEVQSKN